MAPPRGGSRLRVALGIAGLLLLAIPGFAVGLFAGVVWREPELVASHLLGGTREVVLGTPAPAGAAAAPGGPADVAAPPPAAAAAPARPAEERAVPLAALEPAGSARIAVQVGAFGDAASAEKLAGRLRRKGFPAFVSPSTGDAGGRWRVRVGPLPSREEADRLAGRLKAEERLPTWVVEEGRS